MVAAALAILRERIYPAGWQPGVATITRLSILDATVARFSPTSATWLYSTSAVDPIHLRDTLRTTLSAYPQFAGQLRWVQYESSGTSGHTHRYGRLEMLYGGSDDPGVEFVHSRSVESLDELVPSAEARCEGSGIWDASIISQLGLLPVEPALALHDLQTSSGLPCVVIQVTEFACGGLAVAIKIAHPIADAQSLIRFARDWATTARGATPLDAPIFDPRRLDAAAAGDVDAVASDPALVEQARALPLHRFDWWAQGPAETPTFIVERIPDELKGSSSLELPGMPLPWHEWDVQAPVSHMCLHFSPATLRSIAAAASATGRVSTLDALLAHVWAAIVRARGLANDDRQVYLDVTLGARARVDSPLPESFLGSPIFLAHASLSAKCVADSVPDAASAVRGILSQFTPTALSALLHQSAFTSCPHRYWDGFLGTRHTLVTSWLRLGVYDIDFTGSGAIPRYVDALMPNVDGCLHVMEAGFGEPGHRRQQWYDEYVSVSLHLKTSVMERLLQDPALHT